MKTKIAFFSLLLVTVITGCDKDKIQTRPQIKIKSINPTVVPFNGSVSFKIEFTDKEGDVNDSFFVKKVRLNQRVVPTNLDSFWTTVPDFPKTQKGEIVLTLDYQSIISAVNPGNIPGSNPPQKEPDTLLVKFLVVDKEGNRSDTATSSQIVVARQ